MDAKCWKLCKGRGVAVGMSNMEKLFAKRSAVLELVLGVPLLAATS